MGWNPPDNQQLRRQVYSFLRQRGGVASSTAIVAHVLRLRNARPTTAERILGGLLSDDPLFVSDGLGNWHLDPRRAPADQPLHDAPITIVEIQRQERGGGSIAEIAFVAVDGGRTSGEAVFRLEFRRGRWELADADDFDLCRWLQRTDAGIWASFRPAPVRRLLNALCYEFCGGASPRVEVSLRRLGKRLHPSERIPGLEQLARLCRVQQISPETALGEARLAAEVWLAIEEQLQNMGMCTVEQLVAFQESRPEEIDFSRFDFDRSDLQRLPQTPGVYVMKDNVGRIIYVGKAHNLARRVGSYFLRRTHPDQKVRGLLERLHSLSVHRTGNELDALLLESRLIRRHRPEFNRQIEIDTGAGTSLGSSAVVFLLPAVHAKRLVLFGLSDQAVFRRRNVRPRQVSVDELQEWIQPLLSTPKRRRRPSESWQIALRWWKNYREEVNHLELDTFASPQEAAAALLLLVTDPDTRRQRMIHFVDGGHAQEDRHHR